MFQFLAMISDIKDFLKDRTVSAIAIVVLLLLFLTSFAEELSVCFLGLLMKDIGFAPIVISTIMAISSLPFLLSLPLGILVDKYNKKKMQIIGCVVSATGTFIFAYAENPAIFALGKLFAATGSALFLKANFVYVASLIPKEYLGKAFGIKSSITSIAELVGPLITGALYLWYMRAPFLAAAILSVLSSLIAFRLPPIMDGKPEHGNAASGEAKSFPQVSTIAFLKGRSRGVIIGLSLISLGSMAIHTAFLFCVIYLREGLRANELAIGSALAFMSLLYIIAPPLLGSLVDRTMRIKLWILIGSISSGVPFLFLPFIPTFSWVYLLFLGTALSPLVHIAQRILVINTFPQNYLGRATGAIGTITALPALIFPFIYGFVWEIFGLRWVFTASFVLMLIPVIIGLIAVTGYQKRPGVNGTMNSNTILL